MSEQIVIPIPIRPDVVVRVRLPVDLTKREAEKIERVVMACVLKAGKGG